MNTPINAEWYYRTLLGPAVAFPVDDLKVGRNLFQFTCSPQTKYSFEQITYGA